MTPILGIMASQISGHLGPAPIPIVVVSNVYESISTVTLGTATNTVTFSSIPGTFKHLQIRASFAIATSDNFMGRFNGDTATNYATHYFYGTGTGTGAAGFANGSIMNWGYADTSNNRMVWVGDILDYSNTNKYKTVRRLNGYDANGSGFLYMGSDQWRSTAAISTITMTSNGGANFNVGSKFALYGIKS